MFDKEAPQKDLTLLTIASVVLTIPFIFYVKDIAKSLRAIANKESGIS